MPKSSQCDREKGLRWSILHVSHRSVDFLTILREKSGLTDTKTDAVLQNTHFNYPHVCEVSGLGYLHSTKVDL